MDKIYLIHDPSRLDRRELYRQELITQGIDYVEIVPAVKDSSNPVRNISQAHKNCIRRAIKDDLPRAIVFEDDVKFSCPGAFNRFLEVSQSLPEDWDVFISGSYDYQQVSYKELTPNNLSGNSALWDPYIPIGKFAGLFCYMVNKKYYQTMLGLSEAKNIDKALSSSGANVHMCYPFIALQHDTFSDNVRRLTHYNRDYANKIKLWTGYANDSITNRQ